MTAQPWAVSGSAGEGPPKEDGPRSLRARLNTADRVFRGWAVFSGLFVLLVMTLIGVFLGVRAAPALHRAGLGFLTTAAWQPDSNHFGIAGLLLGSVFIAVTALVIAFPLAWGMALYVSEYAPARIRRTLVALVDLMAAVPSLIYGIVGFAFLNGHVYGLAKWISTYLGWIPVFHVNNADPRNPLQTAPVYESSTFVAGLTVALMVTPIASSVMREAFSQAPPGEREGAYALGATRWGMIRSVVLPFGRGAMIGGTMLGFGRALGETIAVYLIISPTDVIQPHILQKGASSVSATIALKFGEASSFSLSALMAAGLALFALTLVVNYVAAMIVNRSRSGIGTEA